MIPSVKTLERIAGHNARKLRLLLEGKEDPRTCESVTRWIKECYNHPNHHEMVMKAADEICNTFGVEAIFASGKMWPDYEYLNAGDLYNETLIYNCTTKKFRVGCMADILERDNGRKYG